jgi:LemA protein
MTHPLFEISIDGGAMIKHSVLSLFLILISLSATSCGYNKLQDMEEAVFQAWSDIDSNLQRRADLIPNLVAAVKGYAAHEKETLQSVVEARTKATSVQLSQKDLDNPQAMQNFLQAQGGLSSALARLMVVVERYPDLKANQNFLDLQNQLEGTENRINVARTRYNKAVRAFNSAIRRIPQRWTNDFLLHLERKTYFEAETDSRQVPKIKF